MYDNERVGGAAFLPHKGSTVGDMCSAGMPNLLINYGISQFDGI